MFITLNLVASAVSAFCAIPFWADPKISFPANLPDIQTNMNFSLPISFEFDKTALKVKRKNFIDIIVTGPDRMSTFVDLVTTNDEFVRRVFYREFEAKNGLFQDTNLVIPSLGLDVLPGQYKWLVTVENIDRLFLCKNGKETSAPFTISKPDAGSAQQVTDDYFTKKNYSKENPLTISYSKEGDCSLMSFFGQGGISWSRCELDDWEITQ
jgi:hypothetical protein